MGSGGRVAAGARAGAAGRRADLRGMRATSSVPERAVRRKIPGRCGSAGGTARAGPAGRSVAEAAHGRGGIGREPSRLVVRHTGTARHAGSSADRWRYLVGTACPNAGTAARGHPGGSVSSEVPGPHARPTAEDVEGAVQALARHVPESWPGGVRCRNCRWPYPCAVNRLANAVLVRVRVLDHPLLLPPTGRPTPERKP